MAETADDPRWRGPARRQGDSPGPEPWEPEVWVEEGRRDHGPPPASPPGRSARGRGGPAQAGGGLRQQRGRRLPGPVARELEEADGSRRADRLQARLAMATRAYERDRYQEAERILLGLVRQVPGAPAVRELYGLCLYRRGRWADAIRQLDVFHHLTGSLDQHPVLADCHRALGHADAVRGCWEELREASPSAELVAEGRIVMAESLADRGDLSGAIAVLERAARPTGSARQHHLRQWYALGDLYERAGDLGRARELFSRVLRHDPQLSDTAERVAALA